MKTCHPHNLLVVAEPDSMPKCRARHNASDEDDEGKRSQDVPDTVHDITGRLRKFCLSDGTRLISTLAKPF